MKKLKITYTVAIKRSSVREFTVEANNEQEARELALQEAFDRDWAMDDADYDVDYVYN